MNTLVWYSRRLAAMGPREILHRMVELGRKKHSARKTYGWASFARGSALDVRSMPPNWTACCDEGVLASLRATRDMVTSGRLCMLGATWPERAVAGARLPWFLDPVSATEWPGRDAFCFDVPYRHEKARGDVKFTWELNRLQILVPLMALARCEDDSALADQVWAILQDWMACNPPFKGLNWNSGIELALRVCSVFLVAAMAGRVPRPIQSELVRFFTAHGYWLHRYPSLHSSANNHRIAEGVGLFVAGLALGAAPEARGWVEEGGSIIAAETKLQFGADGVALEQSPTYGAFSAEMIAFAAWCGALYGIDLRARVEERLAAVAGWLQAITDENGHVPRIGDDDEGRVIACPPDREPFYVASVNAALAGLLGRPDLLPAVHPPHLRDVVFESPRGAGHAPEGLRTFREGGYSVDRRTIHGRRALLVFDHGPLGYLSIAAHGHADTLALWLHLDGEPVLVDAGTYLYHSGREWRDAFRNTPLHNTLCVGGQSSSVISGPFMWSRKANGRLLPDAGQEAALTADHDGYSSAFGVRHVRRLVPTESGYDVFDRLAGAKDALAVQWSWLLRPELTAERLADGAVLVRAGERALLRVAVPPATELSLVRGDEQGRLGWFSPAFGERVPATQIIVHGKLGEGWARTALQVQPGGSWTSMR